MEILYYTAGWIEGASEKDAKTLIDSIAEKRLMGDSIGWMSTHKYENGIAYEIYIGGTGQSYLESILETFKSTPEGVEAYGAIKVGDRYVRIDKKKSGSGLTAVAMPESWVPANPELLIKPKGKCKKVQDKRIIPAVVGIVLALVGSVMLYSSFAVRRVPFTPPEKVKTVGLDVSQEPYSQWDAVKESASDKGVIDKFFLDKGKWMVLHRGSTGPDPLVVAAPSKKK